MTQPLGHRLPYLSAYSGAEVINNVFPTMNDPFHIYLKASEIIFMQDFLAQPALLVSSLNEIDLYQPLADLFDEVVEKQ